jgi:hypothetical protein
MVSPDLYWPYVRFMGPGKPSNYFIELHLPSSRWFVGGRMRQPRMMARPGITGSQDFISGAGVQFWLSRDITDGCHMWDRRGHAYNVLVRFFSYKVYTNSNYLDTLRYEWPLVVAIILYYVLLYWWLGLEDDDYGYIYHDDYCITLFMTSAALLMFCLLMHVIFYRYKPNILA